MKRAMTLRIAAALFLLISNQAWGQFLVSSQYTVEAIDTNPPGETWAFPEEIRPLVNFPQPATSVYSGDPHKALYVAQGEFAVLTANDPQFNLLSSSGAVPCVMMILRSQDKRVIAHSHIDAKIKIQVSLTQMIAQMRRHTSAPIEAILVSSAAYKTTLEDIVLGLYELGIQNVNFYRSISVAIDQSGTLFFNSVYSDNIMTVTDRRIRIADEFMHMNEQIESLLANRTPGCGYDCIKEKTDRPLRQLYVSEPN